MRRGSLNTDYFVALLQKRMASMDQIAGRTRVLLDVLSRKSVDLRDEEC